MPLRFLHTADLHLGKTYFGSPGEDERGEDFFQAFAALVADAVRDQVDFVLVAGDLFHTGQILPRTFARTIEILQPLKAAAIPCVAVEGNHDWIHRRERLSWMEALSQMGYLRLLRPARSADGGYLFHPFDPARGCGGQLEIGGLHLYGVGYIGAQAGSHVERICQAVATPRNLLLFHVGIWSYSPVEIGNMQPQEAAPLADTFAYVALGHGHKPYVVNAADGRPWAFNPGSPERVNLGEQSYEKGWYRVELDEDGTLSHTFRPYSPRPMLTLAVDLEGAATPEAALQRLRQAAEALPRPDDRRRPVVEVKLAGRVGFHPFELGRERLLQTLAETLTPLHAEIRNHLSLVSHGGEERARRSLAEIEQEVLHNLVTAGGRYGGREEELVQLALALRQRVLLGEGEGDDLLDLLDGLDPGETSLLPMAEGEG
ncbi:MAG: exonuclease SbcCD subunit D [Desulfuromonadales bacterium]|nr:exonuclease SbcCD subunit D [Desulfuromonadales bacterium]